MTDILLKAATQHIGVEEVFPHSVEMMWRALTTPEMMGRWLMTPTGFEPVVGNHFTYQTTAAGAWDGVIHCEVLEVVPNERLVYTWQAGDEANAGGYGSRLHTVVAWTLASVVGGTRLNLVHSGFRAPANDFAFRNMSDGWPKVVGKIGALVSEEN